MDKASKGTRSEGGAASAHRAIRTRSDERLPDVPAAASGGAQSIGDYTLLDRIERMKHWHKKRSELDIKNGTKVRDLSLQLYACSATR